ncbi:hypothetical protein CRE_12352 [Caenorhabditis remanei]|uniref:Uncharacterized protein n=1 Tax=Caenorhabditis remanei TaxID=31234 RepID=E3NL56_CAERE|nr:hypothetical protein CRE_12352 [Caenorhabditis remanei]
MTTSSQPLSYLSSRCVALYMEPNKRLELYRRCPSFSSAHKSEPMRIKDLKVRSEHFEINGTIYRLGVITQYMDKPNPMPVAVDNAKGGIQDDVDIYGLPPRQTLDETENVEADNTMMASLRVTIANMEPFQFMMSQPGRRSAIERLNLRAEAYNMRINNTPPPYRHYLQLTISTGKLVKIERVVYDKQFETGKEYIEKMVFGIKKIQVENLLIGGDKYRLGSDNNTQHGPPRHEPLFAYTPITDKVKPLLSIQSLEVGILKVTGILANALASLRHISSPLKRLKAVCHQETFPEDPIVNTTEFLEIDEFCPINVLSNRPNYRIHLGQPFTVIDDALINLINEWKKREIPVGTYYSMGETEHTVANIFCTPLLLTPLGMRVANLKGARVKIFCRRGTKLSPFLHR